MYTKCKVMESLILQKTHNNNKNNNKTLGNHTIAYNVCIAFNSTSFAFDLGSTTFVVLVSATSSSCYLQFINLIGFILFYFRFGQDLFIIPILPRRLP